MRRPNDPVGAYRFSLELWCFSLELESVQVAAFSECTGLQLETKVFEYWEGGRNSHSLKFPQSGVVGNITLKRGVTTGPASDSLFAWQQHVAAGNFDAKTNPNPRPSDPNTDIDNSVAIVLLGEVGEVVKRWRLFRPFPVKWVGPSLKAGASEAAIEVLELACEGIEQV